MNILLYYLNGKFYFSTHGVFAMQQQHELYYVTSNPGKFDEVNRYVAAHERSITLTQANLDIPEIQSLNQEKIALDKARKAWEKLKKPLLIDDSGIFFDAYHEFPGTLTKFVFSGIGYDGIFALTKKNNRAFFRLYLIYVDICGNPHSFIGHCPGKIIRPSEYFHEPGFPWNPVFLPDGSDKTYAELQHDPDEKKFSYRLQALQKFIAWYTKEASVSQRT